MKIKNIILTLCCITLGLVLNVGTAFADFAIDSSLTKGTDGWLSYESNGITYYITETSYQDACNRRNMSVKASDLPSMGYGSTEKIASGTHTGTSYGYGYGLDLGDGVTISSLYDGYLKLEPGYAGKIFYMSIDTYKRLGIKNASDLLTKGYLATGEYYENPNMQYVVSEENLKKITSIVEQGFEALAKNSYAKGYVHFSATPPSLSDLAAASTDNSIYFYCDIGSSHSGQYGHAENYNAIYYYIKDTAEEYSADFKKKEIDSTDPVDCLAFSIESSSSNICSVSTMMGVVKDTLLFTEGEIGIINGLLPTIIPIAYCLMVLYFVLEIANIASRDITNISAEIYIKAFAKLIIAVLIIGNSYKIIIYGANLANGLTDMLLTAATGDLSLPQLSEFVQNAARADTKGFLEAVKGVLSLLSALVNLILIPFNFIVVIILSVQCYSRKIEFLIRSLFLPMAIADIAGKGLESGGMRYLRKLVAVGFQGGGIIALTYIAGKLQVVSNSGTDIIIVVALLGSIGLVKAAINEMMGV